MGNVVSTGSNLKRVGTIILLSCFCLCLSWIFIGWAIWDGGYFLTSKLNTDPPRWKPSVNDIVGKWQLTAESIKFARDWGTLILPHEIEFFADGTFKATSFPKIWGWSDEKPNFVFYTGTGTWRFDKMRLKPWALHLYYDNYNEDFSLPDYYFLQGKEAPYKIEDTPSFMFEKK
jgi:hypothetical protein